MLVKRMYGVLLMMETEPAGDCIFKVGELKISYILFPNCGLVLINVLSWKLSYHPLILDYNNAL